MELFPSAGNAVTESLKENTPSKLSREDCRPKTKSKHSNFVKVRFSHELLILKVWMLFLKGYQNLNCLMTLHLQDWAVQLRFKAQLGGEEVVSYSHQRPSIPVQVIQTLFTWKKCCRTRCIRTLWRSFCPVASCSSKFVDELLSPKPKPRSLCASLATPSISSIPRLLEIW